MRTWQRNLLGSLLIAAVAVAGIALNFTLLGLTQDAHDPVGKLSPRAVFSNRQAGTTPTKPVTTQTTTSVTTQTTETTTTGNDSGSSHGDGQTRGPGDSDSDD